MGWKRKGIISVASILVIGLISWYPIKDQWIKDHPIKIAEEEKKPPVNNKSPTQAVPQKSQDQLGKKEEAPSPETKEKNTARSEQPKQPIRKNKNERADSSTKQTAEANKKEAAKPSIQIDAFESKSHITFYNPGERKIFVSHLSYQAEELGFSGVMFINDTIEGKSTLVHKFTPQPKENEGKFGTVCFTEDLWQKLILKWRLKDSECILWFFFTANDPGYQTIQKAHGDCFQTVPMSATLYFRVGQGEYSQNINIFALPLIRKTDACKAVVLQE